MLKICPTCALASDQVSGHVLLQFLYPRSYLFFFLSSLNRVFIWIKKKEATTFEKLPCIRHCSLVSSCLKPGESHYALFTLEGTPDSES